jgi:hypothetical protein
MWIKVQDAAMGNLNLHARPVSTLAVMYCVVRNALMILTPLLFTYQGLKNSAEGIQMK